jgi:hypothetical protein
MRTLLKFTTQKATSYTHHRRRRIAHTPNNSFRMKYAEISTNASAFIIDTVGHFYNVKLII